MLFNLGSYAFQLGKRCFSTLGVMISKTRNNAFEFRGRRIRSVDKDYSIFYATRRVPTLLGSNRKKLPLLTPKKDYLSCKSHPTGVTETVVTATDGTMPTKEAL